MEKLIKAAALCAAFLALILLAACVGKGADGRVFDGAIYEKRGDAPVSERSLPQEEMPALVLTEPAEEREPEPPDVPAPQTTAEEEPSAAEDAEAPPQTAKEEPPASEKETEPEQTREEPSGGEEKTDYVLNINSKKFHRPDCSGVASMKEKNRQDYKGTRQEVLDMGYSPCGICKP